VVDGEMVAAGTCAKAGKPANSATITKCFENIGFS
jgi:hypothetical protein